MRRRLVCFNNFYYCRFQELNPGDSVGQYASIISTIVDYYFLIYPEFRLVCFNNFYYCRCHNYGIKKGAGLVCFNNFYYCRFSMPNTPSSRGQYASIISTIVDTISCSGIDIIGQYASIISTIVDYDKKLQRQLRLVCFNNFYYCRSI